jgi:hypothetical protein
VRRWAAAQKGAWVRGWAQLERKGGREGVGQPVLAQQRGGGVFSLLFFFVNSFEALIQTLFKQN